MYTNRILRVLHVILLYTLRILQVLVWNTRVNVVYSTRLSIEIGRIPCVYCEYYFRFAPIYTYKRLSTKCFFEIEIDQK